MTKLTSVQGHPLEAYIISFYDEHQHQKNDEPDQRVKYISGFTGSSADVVVSLTYVYIFRLNLFLELEIF
jgi:hypothetical protein